MDIEQLIESIFRRVDAFLDDGDADPVLAPEAIEEAGALPDVGDADALAAVAWLCWCRYFAGDPGADVVSAYLDRFLAVRAEHPDALPDHLVAALDLLDGGDPGGDEFDPHFLHSLGGAFSRRFDATEDRLDLDRAVAAMTAAVARLPAGDEFHGAVLCQLGAFLTRRGRRDAPGSPDHAEAERVLTASLAVARPEWRYRPVALMNLVNLRAVRYETSPGPESARLLIEEMSRALRELDPGDEIRALTAGLAADLLVDLGDHVRLEEPDTAIALYRLGVEATRPGQPLHVHALGELGGALTFRGGNGAATADFDEAIEVLRRAADLAEGPLLALAHTRLCLAHLGRFERLEDPRDIADGIAAGRAALGPARGERMLADFCVTNLASVLISAHDSGVVAGALAEAIELLLTAVDTDDANVRARARLMLGNAYRKSFSQTSDAATLDEAIRRHRSSIETFPPDQFGYADHLNSLAAALMERARRFGGDEDLDEAIELFTAAAARMPQWHPERLMYLANLVQAHLFRHDRHGDPESAARASAIAREITGAEVPAGMAATQLGAIGSALITAYDFGGSPADLDEAVAVMRRCVAVTSGRGPAALNQLGSALIRRHERTGAVADVVEAVESHRAALASVATTDSRRGEYLTNLCNALEQLYHVTGDLGHLDEAVRAGAESTAADVGSPTRVSSLTNLSKAAATRYHVRRDPTDLDLAVEAQREALALVGPDNPRRVRYLSNLGGSLADRFLVTGEAGDLDEAVALLRECAERTTAGDTRHATHLHNLGLVLVRRHRAGHDPADLAEAVGALSAAASGTSPAIVRVQAARLWAVSVAEHDVAASLAGYEQAVALFPVLAWHGLHREDRERQLLDLVGVASDAAATALAAGRPERAVELLEQGRSVLWSQLLDLRTDFLALRGVRPDLARRLEELRDGLEEPPAKDDLDPTPVALDHRMALARQWDETVAEVRGLPGLADFLRPRPCAELLGAAADGPIVIVNVSALRCDALVMTPDGVDVVPLPGLTAHDASERADELAAAAHAAHDLAGVVAHNAVLSDVLAWLWQAVAEPVLAHVGAAPRLWWCPTGALTRLPLHAAGIPGTPASVPDLTVSSYTPTVRALSLAREGKPAEGDGVLVVAVPEVRGAVPLDVEPEVAALAELSPGRCTVRRSADAVRDRVLADLPRHGHAHFACHGVVDPSRPSASGLLLHDERLTVADVSRLRLGAELAYLSACDTASGGDLPDESLHLGAGLNLAGYRHVVATLWPIHDATAGEVARGFYGHLGASAAPDRAAFALHEAVRDMRARGWDTLPTSWVPYVHVGP
ncbi:CHAT domain-containing protein [Actinosynnema sp. NPDC023794]